MSENTEILVTIPATKESIDTIQKSSDNLSVSHHPVRRIEEISTEVWDKAEILFTMRTFPEPEQAPNLRWVQLYHAGVDRMLDSNIFKNPEIQITSLSGANASQVSEHILAMMLALGRRLPDLARHQGRNDWPTDRNKRFTPLELRGSTVGIVGYGSLGRQTARLLHTFGADILASKVDLNQLEDQGYTPDNMGDPEGTLPKRIYPAEALRSMFKDCDFVIITTPLTDKSREMIGQPQLDAMKSTAFLIDVSRGGVVDHETLIQSLQTQKIAGAALDVFPEEPLASDSPLWEMKNVIISPHIAGISKLYEQRAFTLFVENLQRYLEEQPLLNIVDPQQGY